MNITQLIEIIGPFCYFISAMPRQQKTNGLPLYEHNEHWKDFFPEEKERKFLEATIDEKWIPSEDTQIHLDIYDYSKEAPTIIYCHGLSSCGRMMGHLVQHIFKKGYNIICPDLVGFGMTTEKHGTGTIGQFTRNLLDVVAFAKQRFKGPRFLTGISMGGALSYYTATCGADVNAIACFCLMDFSNVRFHSLSTVHHLLRPLFKGVATIFPGIYIPIQHFLKLDNLCQDPKVIEIFKSNPLALKSYTTKFLHSLITSSPEIPFEDFDHVPVMVLHAKEDKLIPEHVSKKCYERLGGKKEYVGLRKCGHIPIDARPIAEYVHAIDGWFRTH